MSDSNDSVRPAPSLTELRSYTPLQVHFVTLLNDLLIKREALANSADAGDWRLLLIDKTIYSTYQDCRNVGVGEDARLLFSKVRASGTRS